MRFTAAAIVLGLAAGLLAGGRPGAAAGPRLRWWPVLVVGAAAQLLPEVVEVTEGAAFAAVVVSYAALIAFAAANLRVAGMPVVLLGLTLNLAVILPNGGMPVQAEAVAKAGIAPRAEAAALDYGAKRHLATPDDRLTFLGDVVPVRPLREVLSFGDLVLAAGVAGVAFRLLRPRAVRAGAPAPVTT